jgi:hypothetical protein
MTCGLHEGQMVFLPILPPGKDRLFGVVCCTLKSDFGGVPQRKSILMMCSTQSGHVAQCAGDLFLFQN